MAVIGTLSNLVITTVQIGDAPQTIVEVPDTPRPPTERTRSRRWEPPVTPRVRRYR
jgi:hypothetical protein